MDNEISLKKAQALFDSENYTETVKMCTRLIEETDDKFSAVILASKGTLFMLNTPNNSDDNKYFYEMISEAVKYTKSLDDVNKLYFELYDAFDSWKRKVCASYLRMMVNNPVLESYESYLDFPSNFIKMETSMGLNIINNPLVIIYSVEKGKTPKEYAEEVLSKIERKFTYLEMCAMQLDAACEIYNNAKSQLMDYNNVNTNVSSDFKNKIREQLLLAKVIISNTVLYCKEIGDQSFMAKCLKTNAEILTFTLDAYAYSDGQPVSIYCVEREEELDTIKTLYKQISEIEPDFVAPKLPSAEILTANTNTNTNNQNSGGCYVATAVYGSYDCPQVWTLRRYRDNTLSATWYGRAFIHTYYAISPILVKWFGKSKWFKNLCNPTLDSMIKKLNENGIENTPYNDRNW